METNTTTPTTHRFDEGWLPNWLADLLVAKNEQILAQPEPVELPYLTELFNDLSL